MTATDKAEVIEQKLTAQINLYYDVIAAAAKPAPLLIALHGYGANKWHAMREAKSIAPEGFALAALQGPHQHLREPKEKGGPLRFGFGWLTNFHPEESVAVHHQALLEMIAGLIDEEIADRDKIFLLGFSQSCALNYRFAFTHPDVLRGVCRVSQLRCRSRNLCRDARGHEQVAGRSNSRLKPASAKGKEETGTSRTLFALCC
jgi:predicted esterase